MPGPFDRLTILVVDDQELMRSVTVNQLKPMGWTRILTAKNGAAGLSQARANKVDVILSDWNMPVMNGLAFLQAVRSDPKLGAVPFLMITAETERKRIQDVIAAGVHGLLVKPYNAANLRDRLERLLQREVAPAPRSASIAMSPMVVSSDADSPDTVSLPPLHILVVDDNPTSRSVLQKMFADEYDVRVASDPRIVCHAFERVVDQALLWRPAAHHGQIAANVFASRATALTGRGGLDIGRTFVGMAGLEDLVAPAANVAITILETAERDFFWCCFFCGHYNISR